MVIILLLSILFSRENLAFDGEKEKLVAQGGLGLNYISYSFNSVSYSGVGLKPFINVFLNSHLSLKGHYFFLSKINGQSNLNGFGFGARYHFLQPGVDYSISNTNSTLSQEIRFSPFVGIDFLDRTLKTSTFNLSLTGFEYKVGSTYKLKDKWDLIFDLSYASLSLATGSAIDEKMTQFVLQTGISYTF